MSTVQGVVVPDEKLLILCRRMMGMERFRCSDLEEVAVEMEFKREGYFAYRVANFLIQRERKVGNIEKLKHPYWRWVRRFAFCETSAAGGGSPWHIRMLSPLGMKPGGGIDTPGLCGRPTPASDRGGTGGWDLNVPLSEHHLSHACRACVEEYRKLSLTSVIGD